MEGISGRCRQCAHWCNDYNKHGAWFDDKRARFGVCGLGKSTEGNPEIEGSLAFAADSETRAAEMATAPEFGCVQFRPSLHRTCT